VNVLVIVTCTIKQFTHNVPQSQASKNIVPLATLFTVVAQCLGLKFFLGFMVL